MANPNDINRIIDKALTKFKAEMNKIEPRFAKLVIEWIEKFRTTSGNFVRGKANTNRLAGFEDAVKRFLEKSGYNKAVTELLRSYPELSDKIREVHKDFSDISVNKSFVNTYQANAIKTTINNLQNQGMSQALINPIQNQLFVSVSQGVSLSETIKSIRAQLSTTDISQGLLKKVALQGSRDALGQYQGQVNGAIAKEYKLDAIIYEGSLVKDSRPQCERWTQYDKNGKKGLILIKDLPDEIQWAINNGTGFIEGTNASNFFENRGGYNCRHTAWPVRSSVYIKK